MSSTAKRAASSLSSASSSPSAQSRPASAHKRSGNRWSWLLLGLCAGGAWGVAQAQTLDTTIAPPAIGAAAAPMETRVLAVCPGLEAQLAEALGPLQARTGTEGNVVVTFRLHGTVIDDVVQRQGPWVYRSEVRRAVRRLHCDNGQNNKTYALQVSFVDAASDTSTNRVALATSTQLTEVDAAALRRGRTAD